MSKHWGMIACLVLAVMAAPASASTQEHFVGEIRQFETADGLRVVLAHQPAREGVEPRAFVGLYTRWGRSMERVPGLAHFMEHVFANTPSGVRDFTFPVGHRNFDSNAQARVDYVSVWSTVPATAALPRALATTGKLWAADFSDAIIEAERARVVAELQQIERNAIWNASRGLEQAFDGGRPSTADEAALARSLPAADIRAAIAYAYQPEHLVLVVAGDIEPEVLEANLRERFAARGPVPRAQQSEPTPFREAARNPDSAPVVRTHPAAEGFAVAAGFAAPPRDSREYLAMLVLDQFLLGGRQQFDQLWDIERDQDSPLARRLREEGLRVDSINDGRGYGAASPPLAEADPAYFEVNFVTNSASAGDIERRLVRALRAVSRNDMEESALLRARAELVHFYDLWLNAASLRPLGDHLAGLTFHDPLGPERLSRLRAELTSVTPAEVRRVMDRYVLRGDLRLGTFGPATPHMQ